jgi:EAL domain-containing protein (putative c-di-GMP-specific phosphodiesterase class I)
VRTIAVNVSPVQLRNKSFAGRVSEIAAAQGFDLKRLELEITETAFADRAAQCELSLQKLREKGVRIALDDFGTGYSSFTHLRDFRVDRIKIDRSFISEIDSANPESAIIQAIIGLARAFRLQITAEGVETIEQSNFLRSAGCDEMQGYLMSRPLALQDIDGLLGVDPHLRRPPFWNARAA